MSIHKSIFVLDHVSLSLHGLLSKEKRMYSFHFRVLPGHIIEIAFEQAIIGESSSQSLMCHIPVG